VAYPVLDLNFKLHRKSDYYMSSTVRPTIFFVLLAYFSFWIQRNAVPARISLVCICYLALSQKETAINSELPPLSGEVWILSFVNTSVIFILVAAIEYVIVNYVTRVESRLAKSFQKMQTRPEETMNKGEGMPTAESCSEPSPPLAAVSWFSDRSRSRISIRKRVRELKAASKGVQAASAGKLDHIMFHHREDGTRSVRIANQSVETFFRIAFPIAYGLYVAIKFASI